MEHMKELKHIKFMNSLLLFLQILIPIVATRLYLSGVDLFSILSFIAIMQVFIHYTTKHNKKKSVEICKSIISE
jgi:uncharacterized membrane-anchored protein YitT (DUF2179 family)